MTTTPPATRSAATPAHAAEVQAGRRLRMGGLGDAAVFLGFPVAAFLLYHHLWLDLPHGYLTSSNQDQNMWEWFFAVTAHSVVELENPLFTDLQNYPLGVNLMANTVMFGIGVPLAPVTLIFGPTVTWALVLTGGLAGTAVAWYWVLSRHLVHTRSGAAIGAAFCGFAPPIVSHGNAHPNFVVLFLLPFIVLRLVKLAHGENPVRNGVLLGLLVAYQIFLGEEVLLITATTLLVFAMTYALMLPEQALIKAQPLSRGLAVTAGVVVPLVAVPLWWQFFGPQSYSLLEHGLQGNDAAAFTAFPSQSLAGDAQTATRLSMNPTEENAFFGWPLLLLMVGVTIALWRVVLARALAVTMFVMAWLSTGVLLVVDDTATSVPGPWLLLFDLPLFDSLLESRLALGCVPLIGMLLAMATDRVRPLHLSWSGRYSAFIAWLSVVVFVFVPITPTPLPTGQRPETPAFFADGHWRHHVDPGGSVAVVPLPKTHDAHALRWQVDAGLEFPIPGGYFVGPGPEGKGIYGPVERPTSDLLRQVVQGAGVPEITEEHRSETVEDLRFWKADVVVLPVHTEPQEELRETVEQLLGHPGRVVADAWVWDVRAR